MMMSSQLAIACDLHPHTPQSILDGLNARTGYDQRHAPALCLRCDVADEELDTYVDLLEMIAVYSATEGFVGYLRVPWDVDPGLIYFRNGKVSLF